MTNNTQSRAEAMVQRVKLHYDGMQKATANTERVPESRGGRDSKGRYATGVSGNPGGKYKGIADYVKSKTNNYQDLIDLFLEGAAGKRIDGHTPTFRERVDCANALLDRTIGKPTQMVVNSSEDTAKELLAIRQEALRLQKQAMVPTEMIEESDKNVSSIRLTAQR